MKANTLKSIFVLSSVLVAAMSMAQGGGQQRAGGQRGGFGAMNSSPVMLIGRADVQKDIKLTDEQKKQLEALREEFPMMNRGGGRGGAGGAGGRGGQGGGGQRTGGQGGQGGGQGGFDMNQLQEMMKQAEAKINEILTDEQETRIKQIGIQLGGVGVFSREDVQKDLAMTVDQKKAILDLQTKQQQANGELMQRMQNQELSREEFMEIRTKNDKIMLDEVIKLLDETQKTKYEAMKGAKFTPDPQQGRGPGGGGN